MRALLLGVLVVVGCAGTPKQAQQPAGTSNGSDSKVTCTEVTDTGSMFPRTDCKSDSDKQDEKEDAQRWVKRPRASPTGSKY